MLKEIIKNYCNGDISCFYAEKDGYPCLVTNSKNPNKVFMQFMEYLFYNGIYTPNQIIEDFLTTTEDDKTIYHFRENIDVVTEATRERDLMEDSVRNMAESIIEFHNKESSHYSHPYAQILESALRYFTLEKELSSPFAYYKWDDDMADAVLTTASQLK